MTTHPAPYPDAAAIAPAPADVPEAGVSAPGRRAATVVVGHTFVDVLSFVVIPLMPLLKASLTLTDAQIAILLATGSVCSGAIQPAVAWLCDRFHTRVFGTIGFAIALLAVSSIGFAESFWALLAIQIIGPAGIGAFHPPAAAAVGHLGARRRSKWMGAFFVAGMIGGILGNVFSPQFVGICGNPDSDFYLGLEGPRVLAYLLIPGTIAVLIVAKALHDAPHRAADAHASRAAWSARERRDRWTAVWLLYFGNVLRFTVNMALVYLVVSWSRRFVAAQAGKTSFDDRLDPTLGQFASELNGPMQAAMQLGMGGMGLAAGVLIGLRHEKIALIALPLFGAGAIACFPLSDRLGSDAALLAFPLTALAGVGFGGMIPVTMAIAQRLLPHRTGLASGLMLGGAWCFAGVGPLIAERIEHGMGFSVAMWVTAGALACSAVLSALVSGSVLRASAR